MYYGLVALHVFVAVALILIVLLQTGKGASLGAAFGGASQTIFGGRGPATFLNKLTTGAAIVFMLTSLALAVLSTSGFRSSIVKTGRGAPAQEVPAVPTLPSQPLAPPAGQ